jgi:hypothetical protein
MKTSTTLSIAAGLALAGTAALATGPALVGQLTAREAPEGSTYCCQQRGAACVLQEDGAACPTFFSDVESDCHRKCQGFTR